MRSKKRKTFRPNRNFDFTGKSTTESKVSQLELHLETLITHGINFRDRIITIKDEIDSNAFALIDAGLSEMESQSKATVTIRINSPGGLVYDALAIIGRLRASKCKIVTEGYGHVMSAATLILACGDERRISSYSWFMTHEASYETKGSHSENKRMVKQAEREEEQWAKWMEEHTTKDSKFWRKVVSDKDAYFSPAQLVELGVVDEVI